MNVPLPYLSLLALLSAPQLTAPRRAVEGALERRWLGNPVSDWLTAAAVAVITILVLGLARYLLVRRFSALAARTTNAVDDVLVEVVRRTRSYLILAAGLAVGARWLVLPKATEHRLDQLLFIAILLQFGAWGNALIRFWVERWTVTRRAPEDLGSAATVRAAGWLGRLVLWAVIILVALENFGVDITALVAGLGITGVAVALAVQNILGDLMAALSIVIDKPFVVGDFIVVGQGIEGTVERIGLKTTRLRSLSGEQIILANAELLKAQIRNYKRMSERRATFNTAVTYDTDPEKLARIPAMLRELVEAQPHTRFDRAHFARFQESWLEYETVYFL
ncbi:MAG TPA: mechanosensitive ion channel family protein, partial [Gemmatimonadaceae bacterium]|nr:mechanosensitive ion channel family protein [Gemmatimonadaceae bacterium]